MRKKWLKILCQLRVMELQERFIFKQIAHSQLNNLSTTPVALISGSSGIRVGGPVEVGAIGVPDGCGPTIRNGRLISHRPTLLMRTSTEKSACFRPKQTASTSNAGLLGPKSREPTSGQPFTECTHTNSCYPTKLVPRYCLRRETPKPPGSRPLLRLPGLKPLIWYNSFFGIPTCL